MIFLHLMSFVGLVSCIVAAGRRFRNRDLLGVGLFLALAAFNAGALVLTTRR